MVNVDVGLFWILVLYTENHCNLILGNTVAYVKANNCRTHHKSDIDQPTCLSVTTTILLKSCLLKYYSFYDNYYIINIIIVAQHVHNNQWHLITVSVIYKWILHKYIGKIILSYLNYYFFNPVTCKSCVKVYRSASSGCEIPQFSFHTPFHEIYYVDFFLWMLHKRSQVKFYSWKCSS